jgi:GNAT superfamily N-acetyltransferase
MLVEVRAVSATALREYARIPIAFEVREIFDVSLRDDVSGGFVLTRREIEVPYVKDYDAIEEESPAHWAERFDVSNWEFLTAHFAGRRVGSSLFRAAEARAAARGCRQLKIETQNINLPACSFYARQGCELREINRFAYPQFPDEVQLLWYKEISRAGRPAGG